jgi:hypothetical protein
MLLFSTRVDLSHVIYLFECSWGLVGHGAGAPGVELCTMQKMHHCSPARQACYGHLPPASGIISPRCRRNTESIRPPMPPASGVAALQRLSGRQRRRAEALFEMPAYDGNHPPIIGRLRRLKSYLPISRGFAKSLQASWQLMLSVDLAALPETPKSITGHVMAGSNTIQSHLSRARWRPHPKSSVLALTELLHIIGNLIHPPSVTGKMSIHLVLIGMHNRTLGPYLEAMCRALFK